MPIMELGQIEERLAALPILVFEEGDFVLHEDGATGRLLFLRRGAVEVVKNDMVLARVSEPGAVFGDMALILGRSHTAHVLAVAQSSFYLVEDARAFLEAEPAVARYVMVVLASRLDAANRLLIDARTAYLEAHQRHGVLDDLVHRIGRALHIGPLS